MGEAFRALVPVSMVRATYGVATVYVTADAVDKGKKAAAVSVNRSTWTEEDHVTPLLQQRQDSVGLCHRLSAMQPTVRCPSPGARPHWYLNPLWGASRRRPDNSNKQ